MYSSASAVYSLPQSASTSTSTVYIHVDYEADCMHIMRSRVVASSSSMSYSKCAVALIAGMGVLKDSSWGQKNCGLGFGLENRWPAFDALAYRRSVNVFCAMKLKLCWPFPFF